MDPLASDYASWSTYNYVLGNPVMIVDPDGRAPDSHHLDEDGNVIGSIDDDDDDGTYVHGNGTTLEEVKEHNKKTGETSGGGTLLGSEGEHQLKFSPNSEYRAGDPNDPLHANTADATTVEQFVEKYDGKSLNDITYEGAELLGSTDGKSDSKSGGSTPRYVVDPKTGYIIDMKHFIKVGKNGVLFDRIGEWSQRNKYPNSAYHPQDIYSNALGVEFFNTHKTKSVSVGLNTARVLDFPNGFAKDFGTWLKNR